MKLCPIKIFNECVLNKCHYIWLHEFVSCILFCPTIPITKNSLKHVVTKTSTFQTEYNIRYCTFLLLFIIEVNMYFRSVQFLLRNGRCELSRMYVVYRNPKRYSTFSLFRVWAIPSEIRGHCWWHRRRWRLRGKSGGGIPIRREGSSKPITAVGEKEIGRFCRVLFK